MEQIIKSGWIEVICGPMFAGKSEELIRRIKRLDYAKKKYVVFKPSIDNRYSETEVVSHKKNKIPSFAISSSKQIHEFVKEDTYAIFIDEVQFFDEGIIEVCNCLANNGVRVVVSGLDMDFRGEPFPIMSKFLAIAEDVTKLTAICVVCGAPATMTQRIINGVPAKRDDPTVLVGANESYEPRCRHCHEIDK